MTRLSLDLPCDAASVAAAKDTVRDFLGPTPAGDMWPLVMTVLDEVLSNIVAYAHPDGDGGHRFALEAALEADELVLVVADDGIPFDPLAQPPPDTDAALDDRRIGGLGIMLVEAMMDRVAYERRDGRNVLTMAKALDAA